MALFDSLQRLKDALSKTAQKTSKRVRSGVRDLPANIKYIAQKATDPIRYSSSAASTQKLFSDMNQKDTGLATPILQRLSSSIRNSPTAARVQENIERVPAIPKFSEGFTEGSTLSLYDLPYRPSKNIGESLAYGTGYTASLLNPFNPVNKLGILGGLERVGGKATTAAVSRLAPRATGAFATKALPIVGGEIAQGLAYGGASAAASKLGQQKDYRLKDFATDVAFGTFLRGAGGNFASKYLKQANKANFSLDNLTRRELEEAEDMILNPDNWIGKIRTGARTKKEAVNKIKQNGVEIIERLSAKYLPDAQLERLKSPAAKIRALIDLSADNKLANVPGMGIVDNDPGASKATRGAVSRIEQLKQEKAQQAQSLRRQGVPEDQVQAMMRGEGANSSISDLPTVLKNEAEKVKNSSTFKEYMSKSSINKSGIVDPNTLRRSSGDRGADILQAIRDRYDSGNPRDFYNEIKNGSRSTSRQVKNTTEALQQSTQKTSQSRLPGGNQSTLDLSTKPRQVKQAVEKSLEEKSLYQTAPSQKRNAYGSSIPPDEIYKLNRSVDTVKNARGGTPVTEKVNLLDYFRTPDRVLKKIGLENEAKFLRKKYDDYLTQLPEEINKITEWSKRVPKESNERIFKYLDGQDINLNKQEKQVADEIRQYLKEWADKLDLPEDNRIAHYITHIFEPDLIKKEFDDDIAAIIKDKVPGSVYDPFLQERLGATGYVEDTWRALDAYVKRATRKYNMDQALKKIKSKSQGLEDSQLKYVKNLTARINMRPTQIDNLVDNLVKSIPGVGYRFGQRPVANLSRKARQMIYRGALGLNVSSALKNLTQGANTYAKLGEKYTAKGYLRLMKNWNSGELERVGVLRDNFIQDRKLSATKKAIEKMDKGLFSLFEAVEKINRGAAYFGAKARALEKGLSEEKAIKAGVDLARDTQFTFGSVDTPIALQSDIGKTIGQFQSFTLKQGEFLTEMVKNKEFAGIARWLGSSLAMIYTFGELIGMEPKDLIPSLRFSTPPALKTPVETTKALLNTPDRYGNERDTEQKLRDIGKTLVPFIPAGVQTKKTIEGLGAVNQGASTTRTGRVRYPVEQTTGNKIRGGLFGQYALPGARDYFNENKTPLGPKQSQNVLNSTNPKVQYSVYEQKRENSNQRDLAKEQLKGIVDGQQPDFTNIQPRNAAIEFYKAIDAAPKDDRKATYEALAPYMTPEIAQELNAVLTLASEGASTADIDIALVPEEVRARAIKERLDELTKENRRKKLELYIRMGYLNPTIEAELARIINEK